MAPHESTEIRLVCKADYFDPQLKNKLHEIRANLRQILHTGRRRFALKKVQPWNSIKVTFDIPKEAADRLRLLAIEGNARLVELGILSIEVVGESNAIVVNKPKNTLTTAMNSKEVTVSATVHRKSTSDSKLDNHCSKRMKIENDPCIQNNNLLTTTSSSDVNHINPTVQYQFQPVNQQNGQVLHSNYSKNSSIITNAYVHDRSHDNSWTGYKTKINGAHYYPSSQTSYDMRRYESNLSAQCSNASSTTNTFQ